VEGINQEHNTLTYGTNLMSIIGQDIMQGIIPVIENDPTKLKIKNIIPNQNELFDLISEANFHMNYSPGPGFDFGFEINPQGAYMDPDYLIHGSIPFNLGGL
jgi:hypothetical protein